MNGSDDSGYSNNSIKMIKIEKCLLFARGSEFLNSPATNYAVFLFLLTVEMNMNSKSTRRPPRPSSTINNQ